MSVILFTGWGGGGEVHPTGMHSCVKIVISILFIGGSWNCIIGLKLVFVKNFGKISPCETQEIILFEVRFNPHEVILNIKIFRKTEKTQKTVILKFLWVFLVFQIFWCLANLTSLGFNFTFHNHEIQDNEPPIWLFILLYMDLLLIIETKMWKNYFFSFLHYQNTVMKLNFCSSKCKNWKFWAYSGQVFWLNKITLMLYCSNEKIRTSIFLSIPELATVFYIFWRNCTKRYLIPSR